MAHQDISEFYTKVQTSDFARLFQFRVVQFFNNDFKDHLVYVETASVPGRSINNVQVPFMGLQFNVPGTANYPGSAAYSVTFRCDASYELRDLLERRMFKTFDDQTSQGTYSIGNGENTSDIVESNEIHLALLDSKLNWVREYHLKGAYLQSLGDSAYDIKDGGSIVTIPATIAYQYWRCPDLTPS